MKTIIEMAREAGGYLAELPNGDAWLFDDAEQMERFASLVTEQANARANTSWALMCKKMVEFEREACALIAEQHPAYDWAPAVCEITYAIRARGNT